MSLDQKAADVDEGLPYTREELRSSAESFPARGRHRCRTSVPQFADLTLTTESRLHELIRQGRPTMAMQELIAETGCSLGWAKIWVIHDGRARALVPGPPCPFCGKALRTSNARQCPHCLADFHHPAPAPRKPT